MTEPERWLTSAEYAELEERVDPAPDPPPCPPYCTLPAGHAYDSCDGRQTFFRFHEAFRARWAITTSHELYEDGMVSIEPIAVESLPENGVPYGLAAACQMADDARRAVEVATDLASQGFLVKR